MKQATLAAGCFWGVEEAFRQMEGVLSTAVGYTGGHVDNPSYEDVCTGRTGHAEAVRIEFDPDGVSYERLLEIFWNCHDPTTLNRQGPDHGTQYRSAIFFHGPKQKAAAEQSLVKFEQTKRFRNPIVTKIVSAHEFYRAEEYHQQYLEKLGITHCHLPKNP